MYPCTRTWNGAGQKTAKTAPAWSSPGGGGMLLGGGEDATCPYESSPRYVAPCVGGGWACGRGKNTQEYVAALLDTGY